MIKFFRKIRQNLLSEGKTGKYFKYAVGEIVLVVIGILIALSINNWNENRKTKQFEYRILNDIRMGMEGNLWQLNMSLIANRKSIESADIILQALGENLPYHDSLDLHFSRSIHWSSPTFGNAGYESLKTYGTNLITNDTIRKYLTFYDNAWIKVLEQRQDDYFFQTASPVLTKLFEKVVMRSEMKPFDYEELKFSREYISILNTSRELRIDQVYWHEKWKRELEALYEIISRELKKE